MVVHVFNSSVVSGPETLAIPALARLGEPVSIVFLTETRLGPTSSEGPIRYAREQGHFVHTVPVRGRFDRQAFRELRETLDRIGASVVHAHDVKASTYALGAARARPNFRARLVSTHHGAAARKGKIRLYEEFYVRMVLPKFDAVLAVCSQDVPSFTRRGLRKDRVRLHLNGVDRPLVRLEERAALQREIRARWRALEPRIPADAIILGAVARLSGEKRHDRMLQAMLEAPSNAVLLCFGVGGLEAELREQTRALGLEDRVFWMGYSKTIGREMAGLDLLLCLSDAEGIPINLLEAGWAGTPVFSTRVGGIPDLLDSRDVGFLVEKDSSDVAIGRELAAVIASPMARERVGQAFQRHVIERFSESAWLKQLRDVYGAITARAQAT